MRLSKSNCKKLALSIITYRFLKLFDFIRYKGVKLNSIKFKLVGSFKRRLPKKKGLTPFEYKQKYKSKLKLMFNELVYLLQTKQICIQI